MSLPSEGQSLSANQILSTYLNWSLRYNYFRFLKTKVRHIGNLAFGFNFDHLPEICPLFCVRLPNFVQIEAPTAEIWRHIHYSRWRPQRLNTTSGYRFFPIRTCSIFYRLSVWKCERDWLKALFTFFGVVWSNIYYIFGLVLFVLILINNSQSSSWSIAWMPNQEDRRVSKILWSMVSKAADSSRRQRQEIFREPMALIRW